MDQEAVPATMNKSGLRIEAEKLSQDIQTPCTVLVWIDGAWSGEPVSCKPLFAGGGRQKNHAIDAPRVSRCETSDCRWKQDHDIYENSEQSGSQRGCKVREGYDRAGDPVNAEVPDATDSLNNEFERVEESGEQFSGVRDVLEQLTQKVAIARDKERLAEEAVPTPQSRGRELPERSRRRSSVRRRTRAILARRFRRARRGLTE